MIYLIHFEQPLGTPRHQARNYLGYVKGDEQTVHFRLQEHRAGWGAKITLAANQRGIRYEVVRTLPGDRNEERRLKNQKNLGRLCPICSPKTHQ